MGQTLWDQIIAIGGKSVVTCTPGLASWQGLSGESRIDIVGAE
jgi:hypothetical protein